MDESNAPFRKALVRKTFTEEERKHNRSKGGLGLEWYECIIILENKDEEHAKEEAKSQGLTFVRWTEGGK